MSRFVVASQFRWDEYPGLRPGRIFAGLPDVSMTPRGEAHLVAGPDAVATLCGLPRTAFPHDFPERADFGLAAPCVTCEAAAAA